MSLFYLLPPRPFLGDRLADFLHGYLPGLSWDSSTRLNLADLLTEAARQHGDVFVVYRDELPREEAAPRALVDAFGAEPGDEVIEVRPASRFGEVVTRRWRIEALDDLSFRANR